MSRPVVEPPDGSPAALSSLFAVCLAGIAWSLTVPYSTTGAGIATIGWLLAALALSVGDRRLLSTAACGLVLGVFVAAGDGARSAAVLVGVLASVLAWDLGNNAIGIGRQLGRNASTVGIELRHAGGSLAVGACIVVLAYVPSVLVRGARPLVAVVFLLVAAGLVALVVGPDDSLSVRLPD